MPNTIDNLNTAFAGESQAHMRYLAYADKARKEGQPNIARLFEATAFAERVHATNHLQALHGVQSTAENLAEAIQGETFEYQEMYAAFHLLASQNGDKTAERTTRFAMEAEKGHAVLYADARALVEKGEDLAEGGIHVCDVCGYTVMGEAPDICPVCNVKKDRFRKF